MSSEWFRRFSNPDTLRDSKPSKGIARNEILGTERVKSPEPFISPGPRVIDNQAGLRPARSGYELDRHQPESRKPDQPGPRYRSTAKAKSRLDRRPHHAGELRPAVRFWYGKGVCFHGERRIRNPLDWPGRRLGAAIARDQNARRMAIGGSRTGLPAISTPSPTDRGRTTGIN